MKITLRECAAFVLGWIMSAVTIIVLSDGPGRYQRMMKQARKRWKVFR